jgi:glycine cleavage system H protein
VYAPVSGEILGHNDSVKTDPALVNNAAEGDGWLLEIKLSEDKDLGKSSND